MKKTPLLIILSALAFSSQAQNGLLTGKVIDKGQNFSLPSANLKLLESNRYTISNQDGSFEFLDVPAGNYKLITSYIGYNSDTTKVTIGKGVNTSKIIYINSGAIIGNEVVVLGDRLRGQAKALNQQKNNSNISNIVSSDQVGRFPDANIGDALKRIPGVTMQNDQGEARNIIIRGLAPELNSVTLNGSRIPSAEGDNRRVQMDLIPSDMVQTIEVNKTLTSDMDADAIGGSVNLVTRTAPNSLRISGTLSSGYNPIRGKALYTGAAILANRFFDKKLGAILSVSYNNNNYGSDNAEFGWKEKNGKPYVFEQEIRKYNVQRIRRSVSAALDYKINNKNTLFFTGMYNWRDDWENRFRFNPRKIELDDQGAYTGVIRNETKGGIGNDRNHNARLEDQRVRNFELRGKHLAGESIAIDWDIAYSKASENRPNERYISWEQKNQSFNEDLSSENNPMISPSNFNVNQMKSDMISENHNYTDESELSGRLNVRIPFSLIPNQKGRIRIGTRMRLKNKMRDNNFFEYKPVGDNKNLFTNFNATGNSLDMSDPNFQAGNYRVGYTTTADFLGALDLNNPNLFEKTATPSKYLAVNYRAKENIYAGYIRFDQDINNKLTVITGIRTELTKMNYSGNYAQDGKELLGVQKNKTNYLNVLPNIALKYSPSNSVVLRSAFSTSIARPNYYSLTPYINTAINDNEINAGNPNLKAAYAYNYDIMAEKYYRSVGILSGGLFYKKINNFIYQYRSQNYFQADFAHDYPNVTNPITDPKQNWIYQQARNGQSVAVYGFEVTYQRQLDFLPGILKNFGVYANYTYTRSKAKGISNDEGKLRENISLPGTAPNMYNLSLSYEDKKITARISTNFADAYIDELGGNAFSDRYYDKQFFLDANASYKITPKFRAFVEANNLTNQPLRYYQGLSNRTAQVEYYRPRYNAGIKYDLF